MELHHLRYTFGLDRKNKDEGGASKREMSERVETSFVWTTEETSKRDKKKKWRGPLFFIFFVLLQCKETRRCRNFCVPLISLHEYYIPRVM